MKIKYQCKSCDREYLDYEDAKDCAVACADLTDDLVETIHICDYCKETSHDILKIERCEKVHEEEQDEFYHQQKLNEARDHPEQSQLNL